MNVFKKVFMKLFKKGDQPVTIDNSQPNKRRLFHRLHFPDLSGNPKIQFLNKYSILFHILLAAGLDFTIESISRWSVTSTVGFVFNSPLTFAYNSLLIFASLLIVFIFKRRALVRIGISVFWVLLGIVNGCLLASRVTPFNFTDLKLIGDLLAMKSSKYFSFGEEVAVVVFLVLIFAFLVFLGIRGPKFSGKVHHVRNITATIICIAAIPFITKAAIHSDILAGYFGNLAEGYKEYGFVYSFSASVVDTGMSKPKNYSKSTVEKLVDSESTKKTTVKEDDMPNIIFVQLESFMDPYQVKFLKMSEDPIPNFRKLMNNYSTGTFTVPVVGAGTVNTEFEALTGMGIQFFGLGEYPYKTVLKTRDVESAADDLSQIGYSTHVIHNNTASFYGRSLVFSQMGFDTFTSKEMMNITSYNEIDSWPTDDILTSETLKALDSTKNQSDFIYTITVQSHGSYPDYKVFSNPAIKVSGAATQAQNYEWEYYINEIHEVDEYIGDLTSALSKRKEKTIVVMYGDHLPTMGLSEDQLTTGSLYDTTYVTWNNFGLNLKNKDLTSYQIMAYITNKLGIHEGTVFKYHQTEMAEGKTDSSSYLSGLEDIQYDLLYGNRYAYDQVDKYPASNLQMGVEDIKITKAEPSSDGTSVFIYGSNFTPWSKVYINGAKVDTTFVSTGSLEIPANSVKAGDTVMVNQIGSGIVLRSSNSITYESSESTDSSASTESSASESK